MLNINRAKISSIGSIACRHVHRNHPGFKQPPPAFQPRLDLPDRYTEEANYPPVKPRMPPGEWPEEYESKLAWRYWEEGEKYTRLRTIQERLSVLAYLNVQQTLDDLKQRRTRHYPIFLLSALPSTPKMSPYVSYITKTHLQTVKSTSSGDFNTQVDSSEQQKPQEMNKSIDFDLYEKLKHLSKEVILANLNQADQLPDSYTAPEHPETFRAESVEVERRNKLVEARSDMLIKKLFSNISSVLATKPENEHLAGAQYGEDVNIRAYWKRCGFDKVRPRGAVFPDTDVIRFQFEDKAAYQIKCDKPLKPVRNSNLPNSKSFQDKIIF